MIDRVYTGYRPAGLMKYLFGPGKYDEHTNPRVVATWDGRPEQWQPEHVGPGEFDFDLGPLISALQAPAKAAGLPVVNPDPSNPAHNRYFRVLPDGERKLREGYVFHLTLRNERSDRKLSDQEWAHIAQEMMHRSGVARRGDAGAPRWVAVRHDDDGIHIQATLVRQDTNRRVYPKFYKARLRKAAEAMERMYGITSTAPADRTAAVNVGRGEQEKAARQGRHPARIELRDAVAQAAAVSLNEHDFERALIEAGYLVEISRLPSGDLRGCKFARPGDVDRRGKQIWFSGSKLAADLSMPKLVQRWEQARRGQAASSEPAVASGEVWVRRTLTVVERARLALRSDPELVDGIAHAVGEVHSALDRGQGRLIHSAGAQWDRASRAPFRPVPVTAQIADELRWMARGLGAAGTVGSTSALELAAALAALGLQIAALLQQNQRDHQARAARQISRWVSRPQPSRSPARPTPPLERPDQRRRPRVESGQTAARRAGRQESWKPRSAPVSPPRRDGPQRGRGR